MVDRVKAAVDAKTDQSFVIMRVLMRLPSKEWIKRLSVPLPALKRGQI
ncbi:hypothetical protein JCM19239_201 [Vibrio variabilis]|nr:hypothetical protein JCM19239_201 [Vibrio variabilis]